MFASDAVHLIVNQQHYVPFNLGPVEQNLTVQEGAHRPTQGIERGGRENGEVVVLSRTAVLLRFESCSYVLIPNLAVLQ